MFRRKTTWLTMMMVLTLSLILAACGGGDADEGEDVGTSEPADDTEEAAGVELGQENLTIPYVAWAREAISTHILAALLEDIGYNVETRQVEAGPMWASVADGSADFHTSAWLPATHASYWDEYKDDLVQVKEVLDRAPLALAVPAYVEDINSMEDLKDNTEFGEAVNWEITGIDAGAGIMSNTQKAIEEYELDNWSLRDSSES